MSSAISKIEKALINSYNVIGNWDGCAWIDHGEASINWLSIPVDDRWGEKEHGLYMGCIFCGAPASTTHAVACKFAKAKRSLRVAMEQ